MNKKIIWDNLDLDSRLDSLLIIFSGKNNNLANLNKSKWYPILNKNKVRWQ